MANYRTKMNLTGSLAGQKCSETPYNLYTNSVRKLEENKEYQEKI